MRHEKCGAAARMRSESAIFYERSGNRLWYKSNCKRRCHKLAAGIEVGRECESIMAEGRAFV